MKPFFFFATNTVEVARRNPSNISFMALDGAVPGAAQTFDHHQTGERINLDSMPASLARVGGYATTLPDVDAAASMVAAALGGEGALMPETAAILRCASHWCDYLSPNPAFDAEQNRLGRGLLDWFNSKRPRLKFGETDPNDGAWFNAAVNELLDAVFRYEDNIGDLPYVDDYAQSIARARAYYSEGGLVSGFGLAIARAVPGKVRDFGPDAVCALLPGDARVVLYVDGDQPGKYRYTVGVNPLSPQAPASLAPLLAELAALEYQAAVEAGRSEPLGAAPIPANKTWGGRPTVFGSPWGGSWLEPIAVEFILRRTLLDD